MAEEGERKLTFRERAELRARQLLLQQAQQALTPQDVNAAGSGGGHPTLVVFHDLFF